jgi:hypothetical protein
MSLHDSLALPCNAAAQVTIRAVPTDSGSTFAQGNFNNPFLTRIDFDLTDFLV